MLQAQGILLKANLMTVNTIAEIPATIELAIFPKNLAY